MDYVLSQGWVVEYGPFKGAGLIPEKLSVKDGFRMTIHKEVNRH